MSKMLCGNCEKVVLKSIQRKYYKTVMNIEIGEEVKLINAKEEQIPVKIKAEDINNNIKNNAKEEQSKEKKLMIFD